MTFSKIGVTLGVSACVFVTLLAATPASAAMRHGHHMARSHHGKAYNYGSRTDAQKQTRTGGPAGGLRNSN